MIPLILIGIGSYLVYDSTKPQKMAKGGTVSGWLKKEPLSESDFTAFLYDKIVYHDDDGKERDKKGRAYWFTQLNNFLSADQYMIQPFRLIYRSYMSGLYNLDDVNDQSIGRAEGECSEVTESYRGSGEGFGSSDFTFLMEGFLRSEGIKTAYVDGYLKRVDKDGKVIETKNRHFPNLKPFKFEKGGEISRFDRHKNMDSDTLNEVLQIIKELRSEEGRMMGYLENYLYGLFDGYDYSGTEPFKEAMKNVKSESLKKRIIAVYDKVGKYPSGISDKEMARNWWSNSLSINEQNKFIAKYEPVYSPDYMRSCIYNEGNDTILKIWQGEGSPSFAKGGKVEKLYAVIYLGGEPVSHVEMQNYILRNVKSIDEAAAVKRFSDIKIGIPAGSTIKFTNKEPYYYSEGGAVGENGYIAFYKGKEKEVYAKSSYEAQQKAAKLFGAKKSYDVTVVLAEKNGEQVTHSPSFAKGGMNKTNIL